MIKYISGNLFHFMKDWNESRLNIILHVCNNHRKWGSGFVLDLGRHFPNARETYFKGKMDLGTVQICNEIWKDKKYLIDKEVHVVNMICQDGFTSKSNPCALDYNALKTCLSTVSDCYGSETVIHMPLIGSHRSGGHWNLIYPIIDWVFPDNEIKVYYLNNYLPPNFDKSILDIHTEV